MKIAIIGYGKMGHMIEEVALSRGHEIVATIDAGDAFDLKGADVAIEFTTPATAEENIHKAWAQGVPVVSGSTGWDAAALIDEDRRTHDKQMLVWSSNYSVGVNIFFEVNKLLAVPSPRPTTFTNSTSRRVPPKLWQNRSEISICRNIEISKIFKLNPSAKAKCRGRMR